MMERDPSQSTPVHIEGGRERPSLLASTDLYATQDLTTFSAVAKSALGDLA